MRNRKKMIIYPRPADGISCGSIEIVMTDENVRLLKIGDIIQLNHKLGNRPISDDYKTMNKEQLDKMYNDLQMQRSSLLN
jgi:hypothetical protein